MCGGDKNTSIQNFSDAFADARAEDGILMIEPNGERIPLILGYRDVRRAARDWQTFSSNAPFRVPIPSEEGVRSVRQLPIEADPPEHTRFRKLLEPIFRRPLSADYAARVDALIDAALDSIIAAGDVDIVADFALPVQSKALALLLGMPMSEADIWIGWGTSIFHEGDGGEKGAMLEAYSRAQIARARADQEADDFFAAMTRMEIDGRPLTDDEMVGIANLTFAGGRDTVINALVTMVAYFAEHEDAFVEAARTPKATNLAVEEFVRILSPLSFIGRVCPVGAAFGRETVAPDGRVGLCWAAANYDPEVFDAPNEIRLDRPRNPHMGFGSGAHACLGSAQARALMRSTIRTLNDKISSIEIIEAHPNWEEGNGYRRQLGFKRLQVLITGY